MLAVVVAGCASPGASPPVPPGAAFEWRLPDGFPLPPVPAGNPMTPAKVELGRRLFYDTRLSITGRHACASCHRQELAFTDGRGRAEGATGELHPRGAMSLANVAYLPALTWADPGLKHLEEQMLTPMFGRRPVELGLAGLEEELLAGLAADPSYGDLFAAAFPEAAGEWTIERLTRAIASFERTLVSGGSPYDRLLFHDEALPPPARRGMRLFFSERLGCSGCHGGLGLGGPMAVAGEPPPAPEFHNTGLYNLDGRGAYPVGNRGVLEHTGEPADMGRFRAPTLRNVAVTAPYMHDGSIPTLAAVIEHYAAGGRNLGPDGRRATEPSPHRSPDVAGFVIDEAEKSDLLAFLDSLTDEAFLTDPRFADPFERR